MCNDGVLVPDIMLMHDATIMILTTSQPGMIHADLLHVIGAHGPACDELF